MGLKKFQIKNVDHMLVGKVFDSGSYYSPAESRVRIHGVQELSFELDIDTAENKAEGWICGLYGRAMKATGSVQGGKVDLQGLSLLTGAVLEDSPTSSMLRLRRIPQIPFVFFDIQSLWDQDNGNAENRLVIFKARISSLSTGISQDNFTQVSFDFDAIFTSNPVDRSIPDSLELAAFGRNETALDPDSLGDIIETAAL